MLTPLVRIVRLIGLVRTIVSARRYTMNNDDAIDLLQEEDESLVALLGEFESFDGPGVVNQSHRGDLAKQLIRHVGSREAAKADILRATNGMPGTESLRESLKGDQQDRRTAINRIDRMIRHVRPLDVSRADGFYETVGHLSQVLHHEIAWELNEGIETLRADLPASVRATLHRAHYLRSHAPTQLGVSGLRWYQRMRVMAWVVTKWDHLQDRPRPRPGARAE
jgi:hypothetical protein